MGSPTRDELGSAQMETFLARLPGCDRYHVMYQRGDVITSECGIGNYDRRGKPWIDRRSVEDAPNLKPCHRCQKFMYVLERDYGLRQMQLTDDRPAVSLPKETPQPTRSQEIAIIALRKQVRRHQYQVIDMIQAAAKLRAWVATQHSEGLPVEIEHEFSRLLYPRFPGDVPVPLDELYRVVTAATK